MHLGCISPVSRLYLGRYGALNFFSVLGGLLFFQEGDHMQPWQLSLVLGGCAIMTVGIAVGLIDQCARGSSSGGGGTRQPAKTTTCRGANLPAAASFRQEV